MRTQVFSNSDLVSAPHEHCHSLQVIHGLPLDEVSMLSLATWHNELSWNAEAFFGHLTLTSDWVVRPVRGC